MSAILLILIFIRPFISSLAFVYFNHIYSALFLVFLITWFIIKEPPLKKTGSLNYPLILFSLSLIILLIFSTNKLNSFIELYKYISGLLLFLIAASLGNKDKVRVIRAIVFAGFIISLLAIYQYFFGFQHTLNYILKQGISDPFALDYASRKRAFLPFITPNTLASYLAMLIPLALTNKNRSGFIIPLSIALLLTKSLGALLSLFLALGLYSYLTHPCAQECPLPGKFIKNKIILLLGLFLIVGLVFVARSTTQKQHLHPSFSTLMRLNYWKGALGIIKSSPLTGVGLGNFNLTLSRYAHNSYLQIWAEMGILGIISILWLIIAVFKSAANNIGVSADKKLTAGLVAANAVFLIHNFVDFSFFLPEVALLWWVILGLATTN